MLLINFVTVQPPPPSLPQNGGGINSLPVLGGVRGGRGVNDYKISPKIFSLSNSLLDEKLVSSQNVGAYPCGRPVGQAQGAAPTPNYSDDTKFA